jgi:hypothetical protein
VAVGRARVETSGGNVQADWSFPERMLVAELAISLARRVVDCLDVDGADRPFPGYVRHGGMNDFKIACLTLWRLGVASGFCNSKSAWGGLLEVTGPQAAYFKFLSPLAIRKKIFTDLPASAPNVDEIIEAYMRIACEYNGEGIYLSADRAPFVPDRQFESEILAFERTGHIVRDGSTVRWSDHMRPAMIAAHFWDDDASSN